MRPILVSTIVGVITVLLSLPSAAGADLQPEVRTLDGGGNNVLHPDWGKAGTPYLRVAAPNYADGIATMVPGPPARYVSNRIFNDVGQNIFSENGISQWGWLWGQFLDHTFGLRDETPAESASIAFDVSDPLERFHSDFPIGFSRTPAAPGTGVTTPRQQINTVSSYIDAFAVYGGTSSRLEWLRNGPVDGNMSNNKASLLLPDNYLPRADARGDVTSAPSMDLMGPLFGNAASARVAGDVRANENIALTAVHTLFAREHNRIVAALPYSLSEESKFQIARRVVGAEEQYITYTQFLPAIGVKLAAYRGYNSSVNASLSNEFATVGYRAHSMIHGELEPIADAGTYTQAQLDAFEAEGIKAEPDPSTNTVTLHIPLNLAFGNPDLLQAVGVGPLLAGLAEEPEYKNDEQIDDSLRSVLFQVPKPGIPDPSVCGEPVVNPDCFTGVTDLGAIDVQRGRDHGMPSYNELRKAYGLAPKTSFAAITGEASEDFPPDPLIDPLDPIDDPNILDFVELRDRFGNLVEPGTDAAAEDVVSATRRTTVAARLKAIYGDVNNVDAFVGMICEPHVPGTEFGELQLAIWKKQFEALRDGDRFFYLNDPYLTLIRLQYGIDYRHTLADVIQLNTGVDVQPNVFKTEVPSAPDTTAPSVSLTAPSAGATVSGTVTVSATASDNVGVAGVQFKLDGANLGSEDTSVPYSVTWDTTTATNGPHTLTAVARDAAGNTATSNAVTVNVDNAVSPTALLGDQQVEPFVDSNPPGLAEAFHTIASASGTLLSLTVYLDPTSTATLLEVGLYAEGSSGHPSLLLAHGALNKPVAGAWNRVIVNPVSVTGGRHYWIALLDPIGTLRFRDRCCGGVGDGPSETSAQANLTTLPDIWATGTVFIDTPLSAYGSG